MTRRIPPNQKQTGHKIPTCTQHLATKSIVNTMYMCIPLFCESYPPIYPILSYFQYNMNNNCHKIPHTIETTFTLILIY